MWYNVGKLGEAEARRQACSYFMDAYAQASVGLPPFRAGPVSSAEDLQRQGGQCARGKAGGGDGWRPAEVRDWPLPDFDLLRRRW